MENYTSLTQNDIDLLFQVEHRCHEVIALDTASRLVLLELLRPLEDVEAIHSLTSTGLDGHRIYLGMTMGRTFLAEVRDGLNSFSEWKP